VDWNGNPPGTAVVLETPVAATKPRKPRAPKAEKAPRKKAQGVYQVLTTGKVAQGDGRLLEVLVPNTSVRSRGEADKLALTLAQDNPGSVVTVHRVLGSVSVQTVSTVKLVRA
jgi:hypothetical protein